MPTEPTGGSAEEICERALARVRDRAEAVAVARVGEAALTRFAEGGIHQNVREELRLVRLTVAVDGRVARAATTRTGSEHLDALAERALVAASLRPADADAAGFAPPAEIARVDHWDPATAAADPDARAAVVRDFVAAAPPPAPGDGPSVTSLGAGYCATRAVHHALAATTGQRASGRTTVACIDGIHRASRPGDAVPADGCAQATSARLGAVDGAACGARAAARARAALDAVELPPGTYEVVLEPRAVAEALLFPAHLGFNGKAHADGTSFVHLGDAQWDAAIDIWDDATDPRAIGLAFDAEGTPRRRVDLVRAGVSVGLTHDRRSARLAGVEPTGHAVGSDALGGHAGDLFVRGGDRSPAELVAGVRRGLLVSDLWYNRVLDPKSQVVTGLTRNGLFLIEHGRIVGAVRDMRYTQSIVAAFGPGRVLGLGDDAQLVGGEGTTMHVPSVHLAAWSFTGGAAG